MLTSSVRSRPRQPPALEWVLAGTPGPRCFAPGSAQPLHAAASISSAGNLTYVYALRSSRAHGHTWCPGRYELNVVPDYSGRSQASVPVSAGSPTFSPLMGSSIFFQIR